MNRRASLRWILVAFACVVTMPILAMQPGQPDEKFEKKEPGKKGPGPGGMNQRRKLVDQFDKDGDGRLNTDERKAARVLIQKDRKGGGKKGPGGFGPGGFGPGAFMSKPLVEAIDSDKDSKVTKAELVAGIKKFFADADKDMKGTLTEAQLAEGLKGIVPAPKGFPGGPKGPPGSTPSEVLAGEILKRADVKKNGKVTLDELTAAAETAFNNQDKDKTGKLDEAAVTSVITELLPMGKFGPGGKGGPGGFGKRDPAKPGPKVTPADVKNYPDAKLYDTTVLRTIFIDFENTKDWEAELGDFYRTDVEVPATVTVDGKKYPNVGIRFRGNSSYFMAPQGYKHSMNLSFDFADSKQRLYGYRGTNFLNCADDPSFMHTVLYSNLARKYIPSPQANFVKVVINGESWGIYANHQHFNKDFLQENYQTTKGARWRVPGHPGANAGLAYIGDNIADYKRHYEIKSKDDEKDWKALIELCRILKQTPTEKLEEALKPILDIDNVLWFLAIDNAAINDDGYWVRASDFSIYRDPKGRFHLSPHDTNESFTPKGGKGGPGGGKDGKGGPGGGKDGKGGGGFGLDPLVGLNNARTPLYRLLTVPSLKEKYLANMRTIANDQFDWKKLKPILDQYRTLIEKEVELDTRKLYTLADFKAAHADAAGAPGSRYNLRAFADGRRNYLLNYPGIKKEDAE